MAQVLGSSVGNSLSANSSMNFTFPNELSLNYFCTKELSLDNDHLQKIVN